MSRSTVRTLVVASLVMALAGCRQAPRARRRDRRGRARPPWFDDEAAAPRARLPAPIGPRRRHLPPARDHGRRRRALRHGRRRRPRRATSCRAASLGRRRHRPAAPALPQRRRAAASSDVTAGSGADVRGYGMGVADRRLRRRRRRRPLRHEPRRATCCCRTTAAAASPTSRRRPAWPAPAGARAPPSSTPTPTATSTSSSRATSAGRPTRERAVLQPDRRARTTAARRTTTRRPPTCCSATTATARFTDVSARGRAAPRARGNGLGVVADDFDGDGRVDVFVANDGTPNQLWMNQGDGTLRGVGAAARRAPSTRTARPRPAWACTPPTSTTTATTTCW